MNKFFLIRIESNFLDSGFFHRKTLEKLIFFDYYIAKSSFGTELYISTQHCMVTYHSKVPNLIRWRSPYSCLS